MDLSRPFDGPELMDSAPLGEAELTVTLDRLARINRRFGGYAPILARAREWSRSWTAGKPVTVLDVGTGGADLPLALSAWARARGFDLRVTAIDPVPVIAAIARRNAAADARVEVLETDLFALAASGRRFDYVISSLLLHHIPAERRAEALRAADALAARGVFFLDLLRSRLAYWGVFAATGLFGDDVTRHDGLISVRKAFRAEELEALAREAGLGYLRARAHPFFRLSLGGEKEAAHG